MLVAICAKRMNKVEETKKGVVKKDGGGFHVFCFDEEQWAVYCAGTWFYFIYDDAEPNTPVDVVAK